MYDYKKSTENCIPYLEFFGFKNIDAPLGLSSCADLWSDLRPNLLRMILEEIIRSKCVLE
jgi:hypothetical protein